MLNGRMLNVDMLSVVMQNVPESEIRIFILRGHRQQKLIAKTHLKIGRVNES
jgi:hypothetical protein